MLEFLFAWRFELYPLYFPVNQRMRLRPNMDWLFSRQGTVDTKVTNAGLTRKYLSCPSHCV